MLNPIRVDVPAVRSARSTRSDVDRALPPRASASKSALRRSIGKAGTVEDPSVRRIAWRAPLLDAGRARVDRPVKPCGRGSHALASGRASWAGTSASWLRASFPCDVDGTVAIPGHKHTNGWRVPASRDGRRCPGSLRGGSYRRPSHASNLRGRAPRAERLGIAGSDWPLSSRKFGCYTTATPGPECNRRRLRRPPEEYDSGPLLRGADRTGVVD